MQLFTTEPFCLEPSLRFLPMATKKKPYPNLKDLANYKFLDLIKFSVKPYARLVGFMKPYKKRFILGLVFGGLAGAVNGIFPLVMHFVVSNIFPEGGGQQDMMSAARSGEGPGMAAFIIPCLAIPVAMLLRGLFSYLNAYCMAWVGLKALNDIRRDLFQHLTSMSLNFFNKERSGMLVSRVMMQTRMAQMALTTLSSDLIKQPINIIVGAAVLFYLDWRFTIIALLLFPLAIVPMAVYGRKVRRSGKDEEEEAGMMAVIITESLQGIRVVKSFAREKYEADRFDSANKMQFRSAMRVRKAMEIVGPLVEVVAALGAALALAYVFFADLSVARFIALLSGMFLLYSPVKTIGRLHVLMQKCLAATLAIFELLDREPDVKDPEKPVDIGRPRGEITFEDVRFVYPSTTEAAIRKLDLTVEAGKFYALVGESGAGKSTILSLILRFYDPTSGRVLLDGVDLRDILQTDLRSQIALVNQDTFLFHDSIYENIRYGRLDASKEEIENAARHAFAHDFIEAQANGYETVIGDKGCRLSGGQQQRLAIARALLKDAPILLLDEATSALDSESERMIQSALEELVKGRTVIAIAHRLSTVMKADSLVVMDKGKVVGQGTHHELLKTSKRYRTLYELQFLNHGKQSSDSSSDPEVAKDLLAQAEAMADSMTEI